MNVSRMPLLDVRDLSVAIDTDDGVVRPVRDVSFHVHPGRTLGIVGESGCGKSLTALALLRLLPRAGRIETGEILFESRDLRNCSGAEIRSIRGNRISMIFQEPMTSLNPVLTVGAQITEVIRLHRKAGMAEAREDALALLRKVRIPAPESRLNDYPHQLSGGMRQRVMIAMALACRPDLLIADEPTTALDVTVQAQILDLLKSLQQETGMAVLLITHDLGVVAEAAHDVIVMYASRVVERAPVERLFADPRHPYTRGLFRSLPRQEGPADRPLETLPGGVPDPRDHPPGCPFHPRCSRAVDRCRSNLPHLDAAGDPDHLTACFLAGEEVKEGRL